MKPWKIDVPVLLTFFVRAETFEKVFESVRKARPRILLLWQDGPRANRPDDIEGVEKLQRILTGNVKFTETIMKKTWVAILQLFLHRSGRLPLLINV